MKRILFAAMMIFAASSCIYDDPEPEFELQVGDRIPDFTVTMTDGTTVTGESLRKGVSLIMFFHSSCPDCQGTLPSVQRIYDEFLDKGVSFAIISRSQLADEIEPYWQEQGYTMPYSACLQGSCGKIAQNAIRPRKIPRLYEKYRRKDR